MIKYGTLKDYTVAKSKLKANGITFTENNGRLVKQLIDEEGKELLSIAILRGNTWVFRYNANVWSEHE